MRLVIRVIYFSNINIKTLFAAKLDYLSEIFRLIFCEFCYVNTRKFKNINFFKWQLEDDESPPQVVF